MVDGYHVDTHINDKLVDEFFNDNYVSTEDSIDDILNENHQNVEDEVQSKNGQENLTINTPIFYSILNDNHESNEEVRNEEDKGRGERNVEAGDNEIPIAHIK